MDDAIDQEIIKRMANYIDNQEQAVNSVLVMLYKKTPNWILQSQIDNASRTIQWLLNLGMSEEQIVQSVNEAEKDELTFPACVLDPVDFSTAIYDLASIRYLISIGKTKALPLIWGD